MNFYKFRVVCFIFLAEYQDENFIDIEKEMKM